MGTANYRTWRHRNPLLSPDHLLPSPVVCRSLPSLKSKCRFDSTNLIKTCQFAPEIRRSTRGFQVAWRPSGTFNCETLSWRIGRNMGDSRLNGSTKSTVFCRFILLKAKCMELCPQGFQKVIVFLTPHVASCIQHAFKMYLSGFLFIFKRPITSSNQTPQR